MVDKTNIKQRIIDTLEGNLTVTNVKKDFKDDVGIICEFIKNTKKGIFRYYWDEKISGIDYVEYNEGDEGDIYSDIHNWVHKHLKHRVHISLKYNGKELIK